MTLTAGQKLGRYKIHSQIGEGGMGKVYLAEDTSDSGRMKGTSVVRRFLCVVERRGPGYSNLDRSEEGIRKAEMRMSFY